MTRRHMNNLVMSVGGNNRRTCCMPRSLARRPESVARLGPDILSDDTSPACERFGQRFVHSTEGARVYAQ